MADKSDPANAANDVSDATIKQPAGAKAAAADASKAPINVRQALRTGLWLLGAGLGSFVLWAALAPLDEGVPSPAMIVVDTAAKQIQHPTGGVVARVAVREGQRVAPGDVLIELSDIDTKANSDATRILWVSLSAMEARLKAEQAGAQRVTYPPELLALTADALAQQQMALQDQLFASRRSALASELSVLGQAAAGAQASLAGLRQSLVAREQQKALGEQELSAVRQMVADGFMPRNRQSELERGGAEITAQLADLRASMARLNESLTEARLRQLQRQQEHRSQVEAQLAETRREAGAQAERLKSAREAQARTVIVAPVAGSVVGLTVQTAGGVVAPGARIMEIVPDDSKLVIEAQIPPHLVDRVRAGLPADINLHAFVNLPQLVVPGRVTSVSATSLSDPVTRLPYFLARIEVTAEGKTSLKGRDLQPGMPADVVVKTGERSMLNYMVRPLLRHLSDALKEA